MQKRVDPKKPDTERAQWQRPTVRKLKAGSAEAGPSFLSEGGSAS